MKHRGGLRKRVLPVSGAGPLPSLGTPVTAEGTELGPLIARPARRAWRVAP